MINNRQVTQRKTEIQFNTKKKRFGTCLFHLQVCDMTENVFPLFAFNIIKNYCKRH